MDTFKLAWRNVWRNPRRSGVTIAATSLALFVMIFYSGLITGYLNGMERNALDLELGEVQIFQDGYRKKPSIYTKIEDHDALLAKVEEAGFRASARLKGSGLAAFEDTSSGVVLNAIDVKRDAGVTDVSQHVLEGRWIKAGETDGVVIGRKLAKTLGVGLDGEIVVLSQGADGSMANDVYKVRGILRGISDAIDRGGIFMTHQAYRDLMIVDEGAHQILVRTPEGVPLDQASSTLKELAPELDVKNWKELMPTLASMLESSKAGMAMMFFIIYLAIAIVILNAMLMAVFERIREFGVLKAIGVGPLGVLKLIYLETLIQTAVAILVGVAIAVPVNHYLTTTGIDLTEMMGDVSVLGMAMDPVWRSEVDASTYSTPIITLIVIVFIAVLYPAMRAAFVRPIDAIRHQ